MSHSHTYTQDHPAWPSLSQAKHWRATEEKWITQGKVFIIILLLLLFLLLILIILYILIIIIVVVVIIVSIVIIVVVAVVLIIVVVVVVITTTIIIIIIIILLLLYFSIAVSYFILQEEEKMCSFVHLLLPEKEKRKRGRPIITNSKDQSGEVSPNWRSLCVTPDERCAECW